MFQPNEATVLGLPPTLNEGCVRRCVCGCTSDSRYGKAICEIWLSVFFWGEGGIQSFAFVSFFIFVALSLQLFLCIVLCNKEE